MLRKVNTVFIFPIILSIFRTRQRGLPHELSSAAGTLGLWVRVPLKPVCVYVCWFSVLVLFWAGRGVVLDVSKEDAETRKTEVGSSGSLTPRTTSVSVFLKSVRRPNIFMFSLKCCECRVLSGRGLCDELITRPEESYRLCCVVVCDLETSRMGAPYI